jgi:hypothetical protein
VKNSLWFDDLGGAGQVQAPRLGSLSLGDLDEETSARGGGTGDVLSGALIPGGVSETSTANVEGGRATVGVND